MGIFGSDECKKCGEEIKSNEYPIFKGYLNECRNCYEKENGKVIDVSVNAKYHGGQSDRVAGGMLSDTDPGYLVLTEENLLFYKKDEYTIEIPLNNVLRHKLDQKEYSQVGGIWSNVFKGKEIVIPYEDKNGERQEPRFSIGMGKTKKWAKQIFEHISKVTEESSSREDLISNLDERLAKGEISEDTYKSVRERLEKKQIEEINEKGKEIEEEPSGIEKEAESKDMENSGERCPECRAELKPDANFCTECGAKIDR